MDRRWFGTSVVALVLAAAVVAPNLATREVAGRPSTVVAAQPPTVGSCVTEISAAGTAFDDDEEASYPSADYGPCGGAVSGEVSSVNPGLDPPRRIDAADYWSDSAQCALDAIGYLGSIAPVVERGAGLPGILWTPGLSFEYTSVGPDAAQRAAGQRWSACIVGLPDGAPYVGVLNGALDTGELPADFSSCWQSPDSEFAQQIKCGQPHSAELLGTTAIGSKPVPAADVRSACAVYAGRVLRTADPTRHSTIGIGISGYPNDPAAAPPAADTLSDAWVSCFVVAPAGHRFTGTLVGIGERPLPLG